MLCRSYRFRIPNSGHAVKAYQQTFPSGSIRLAIGMMVLLAAFLILHSSAWGAKAIPQANPVLRATLSNGLRVVIVKNSLAPVATVVMNYLVGSNEAREGFPGTAHAIEHMMNRSGQLADIWR